LCEGVAVGKDRCGGDDDDSGPGRVLSMTYDTVLPGMSLVTCTIWVILYALSVQQHQI